MSMIGAIAPSGLGCRSSAESFPKSYQCLANWAPITRLCFSSCSRGGPAFAVSSEFSGFRPIRTCLEFSSLLHHQLRAPSSYSKERHGSPEFENEIEEKARRSGWKLLELLAKAVGVAIIACSIFLLRTKFTAKNPRLLRSTLEMERLLAGDIHVHELSSKGSPERSALDSKFVNVNRGFLSSIVQNRLQQSPIKEGGKGLDKLASGGSTSIMPTYVNTAEDQDLLEINIEAFEQWLIEVKDTAVKKGLRESVVVQSLQGIRPSKSIMDLDSNQPEVKLTLEAYLKNAINAYRVNKGVSGFQENELLLAEISSKYGVPSPVLVAIWGIESSYGGHTGNWDVIRALVTLAYASKEPRRAQFYKGELFQALQIIQEGHGPQSGDKLRGSWAGAMGQCQFMPSSFRAYAVDYDGDGRKDIWESRADMFASMANYLKEHGWQRGGLVAQQVEIPGNIDKYLIGLQVQKSVQDWTNKYKVRLDKGQPEIPLHEMASLEKLILAASDNSEGGQKLGIENVCTSGQDYLTIRLSQHSPLA